MSSRKPFSTDPLERTATASAVREPRSTSWTDRMVAASWGGPMTNWVPKAGELVGFMMSTPARTWPAGKTLDERSNVVVQPWMVSGSITPAGGGAR